VLRSAPLAAVGPSLPYPAPARDDQQVVARQLLLLLLLLLWTPGHKLVSSNACCTAHHWLQRVPHFQLAALRQRHVPEPVHSKRKSSEAAVSRELFGLTLEPEPYKVMANSPSACIQARKAGVCQGANHALAIKFSPWSKRRGSFTFSLQPSGSGTSLNLCASQASKRSRRVWLALRLIHVLNPLNQRSRQWQPPREPAYSKESRSVSRGNVCPCVWFSSWSNSGLGPSLSACSPAAAAHP
jgi:hypothetical protein